MADNASSDGDREVYSLRKVLEQFQTSLDAQAQADLYTSETAEPGKELGAVSDDDNDEEAVEALAHLKKKHKAEIDRLESDNKQRKWFFNFVIAMTAIPVVVASIAMGKYVWDGGSSDAVYIGYFASVVVEVIGLSAVIANYLSPETALFS